MTRLIGLPMAALAAVALAAPKPLLAQDATLVPSPRAAACFNAGGSPITVENSLTTLRLVESPTPVRLTIAIHSQRSDLGSLAATIRYRETAQATSPVKTIQTRTRSVTVVTAAYVEIQIAEVGTGLGAIDLCIRS